MKDEKEATNGTIEKSFITNVFRTKTGDSFERFLVKRYWRVNSLAKWFMFSRRYDIIFNDSQTWLWDA